MVLSAANMGREGFLRQLDRHYELCHHLFYHFVELAQAVLLRRGCVAIEWPVSRRYWTLPIVGDFLDRLKFYDARIKGCAYGVRVSGGAPCGKRMAKNWRVMSTTPCRPAKIEESALVDLSTFTSVFKVMRMKPTGTQLNYVAHCAMCFLTCR